MNISYWAWIGTIYLFFLTYQEYKLNFKVDDKYNYLMFGLTISLYSHIKTHIGYILALIVIGTFINIYFEKTKIMGKENKHSLLWLITGFGIIGFEKLLLFIALLIISLIIYLALNKLYKVYIVLPFYIILLFIFILNCNLFHLY